MRKSAVLLLVLVLTVSNVIVFLPVKAEAITIVVPDDYPTIASAIGNATEDDTIFVKKGTYEEHSLIINKTLTLIGEDANSTIIKNIDTYDEPFDTSMAWAIPPFKAIEVRANNVKVLNFTIGEDNVFYVPIGVFADEALIAGNTLEAGDSGINVKGNNNTIIQNSITGPGNTYVLCNGSYNSFIGNRMSDGGGEGFAIFGSFNVAYDNSITDGGGRIKVYGDANTIAKNKINYSGGIDVERGSNNIICGNRLFYGGISVNYGSNNTFYANYIEYGNIWIGGKATSSVLYHNNFISKGNPVIADDQVISTDHFDNGKEGNFWSDYTGEDADGDGVGDTPYTIDYKRKDNYPLMSPFDIDSVSIELPEWEIPSFELPQPEPFPTTLVVVASGASIAVIGIGLLVYFKKRKH